jgi:hypothetical protein
MLASIIYIHIYNVFLYIFLDLQDVKDGSEQKGFDTFVTECFLMECGLRRLAEMKVYELLMSVKENLKAGGLAVRLFARMLGCLNSKEEGDKNSPIDKSMSSCLLYCRKRFLTMPDKWPKPIIVNEGVQIWLPFEPSVSFLKVFLAFLPQRKLEQQCRRIEECAAILSGANNIVPASEIVGARLDIRAAMRRAMIDTEGSSSISFDSVIESNKGKTSYRKSVMNVDEVNSNLSGNNIYVNLHEVLDIIIDSLHIRKQSLCEELKKTFTRGDKNGDGVLSYREFVDILKELPSNEFNNISSRKGLHIFRDALSLYGESLEITREGFVNVCLSYDLIPLVDINELEQTEAEIEAKKQLNESRDVSNLTTVLAAKESAAKSMLVELVKVSIVF